MRRALKCQITNDIDGTWINFSYNDGARTGYPIQEPVDENLDVIQDAIEKFKYEIGYYSRWCDKHEKGKSR